SGGKTEPGEPPAKPEGLTHEPVTGARQGSTVPVNATIDAALGADKVVLGYRPEGASEFTTRDMTEASPGNYEANIPASATGGGFGWTSGSGEVNSAHNVSPAGFAPAQLGHIAPEIGYFVRPGLLLSLQGRIQLVSGVTSEACATCASPPSTAFAAFVKATWM